MFDSPSPSQIVSMSHMWITITLLILEFVLWFIANHDSEYPISRLHNLLRVCIVSAFLPALLLALSQLAGADPFNELATIYYFTLANTVFALIITTALGAKRVLS